MREKNNEFGSGRTIERLAVILAAVALTSNATAQEFIGDSRLLPAQAVPKETAQQNSMKFDGKLRVKIVLGDVIEPVEAPVETFFDEAYASKPVKLATTPALAFVASINQAGEDFENQCRIRIADELAVNQPTPAPQIIYKEPEIVVEPVQIPVQKTAPLPIGDKFVPPGTLERLGPSAQEVKPVELPKKMPAEVVSITLNRVALEHEYRSLVQACLKYPCVETVVARKNELYSALKG